jgi:hypothetical protein
MTFDFLRNARAKAHHMAVWRRLRSSRIRAIPGPRNPAIVKLVAGLLLFSGATWLLILGPGYFIGPWQPGLNAKDFLDLQNAYRVTYAQIIGGFVLAMGAFLTWETLRTNRETQITQRFTAAIGQLGSEKLEIRLGGIFALERIAWDSERDYWPVMEILTAFIREHAHRVDPAQRQPRLWRRLGILLIHLRHFEATVTRQDRASYWGHLPLEPDIQAALSVIGRRNRAYQTSERQPLDLRETDLRYARLEGANLENVNFGLAHLDHADLVGAGFRGAIMAFTSLNQAIIDGADFREAQFLHWPQVKSTYGFDSARLSTYVRDAQKQDKITSPPNV